MEQASKRIRQNRTITVDFQDEATYLRLPDDGKAFIGGAPTSSGAID
jgi:hypothetical protein